MIRVGIVGCGGMGSVHARQYRKRADVELFFFDRNQTRSEIFESTFEATKVDNLQQLIAQVEVIDICLPTPRHHEVGLAAIQTGKAVLMEKPMARTVAEAVELMEAAAKSGSLLMPAQVVRFFPEYKAAHDAIISGKIGSPAAARLRRGGGAPAGADGWFMDLSKSGGVLLDLCVHDFDWLRWTMGNVKHLFSKSVGLAKGVGPDLALTTLTFENGCVAHVEGTWMDPGGFRTSFDIAGSGGLLQHDSRQNAALRTTLSPETGQQTQLPKLAGSLLPHDDPYYLEINAFLNAYQGIAPCPVSALDGVQAVSISEAAILSAETGKVTTPASQF